MNAPREIEAKYAVADADLFVDLLALTQLGPFTLVADSKPIDQVNIYFDTSDRRLQAARHGFRIRLAKGKAVATLKGPATIQDAIHTRNEWEVALPGQDPDQIPAGELRDQLIALIGAQELRPILEIRTCRQIILATRDQQPLVEIALDDYVITAGQQQEQHQELELELLSAGQHDDLMHLAALLRERFVLIPESRSKLERGLALLKGTS